MEDFSIMFEDDAPSSNTFGIEAAIDKSIVDLGDLSPTAPVQEPSPDQNKEIEHKPYNKSEAHSNIDHVEDKSKGIQNNQPDTDDSITQKYFEFMKGSNLLMLPDDFEFDGTNDKLVEAHDITLANMQQLAYSAIMERLPEQMQSLVQYSLKGGTDYDAFLKQNESFDTSTEAGQIEIIKHYYKNTVKWDDGRIERYLAKTDVSDLVLEAEEIKEKLDEQQAETRKTKLAEQEAYQAEQVKQQQAVQAKIVNTIGQAGFIEDKRKQPLKNFIFNAVRKDDGKATDFQRALNQIQTNPEHLIQLADLLMDYDKVKGLTYQRFEKKATTVVTKDLKAKLEQTVAKKLGSIGNTTKEIDWAKFIG